MHKSKEKKRGRYNAQSTSNKRKTDKLDMVRIKTFCASKDATKKGKKQLPKWEKIFLNHISDDKFYLDHEELF